nr:uncharacterized protein LOC101936142 isoform X2 [Chrysemys picta bellii]
MVLCPAELVKCRMQALHEMKVTGRTALARHSSTWATVKNIFQSEGLLGFFQGLTSTWLREVPGYFFFFGGYEVSRSFFTQAGQCKEDLDSCVYHPGVPIFHDALKGWSCCKKRTTDFSEFLSIKVCNPPTSTGTPVSTAPRHTWPPKQNSGTLTLGLPDWSVPTLSTSLARSLSTAGPSLSRSLPCPDLYPCLVCPRPVHFPGQILSLASLSLPCPLPWPDSYPHLVHPWPDPYILLVCLCPLHFPGQILSPAWSVPTLSISPSLPWPVCSSPGWFPVSIQPVSPPSNSLSTIWSIPFPPSSPGSPTLVGIFLSLMMLLI